MKLTASNPSFWNPRQPHSQLSSLISIREGLGLGENFIFETLNGRRDTEGGIVHGNVRNVTNEIKWKWEEGSHVIRVLYILNREVASKNTRGQT